jgi:hypothetical protein
MAICADDSAHGIGAVGLAVLDAIVQDLERLSETEIEQHGKRYILRNAAPGCAGTVLRTLDIALPPLIRCAQPPPTPPPRPKSRRRPRRRSANARTASTNALI